MKCPSCSQPPISLKLWLIKYSWARWSCRGCKAPLKANSITWLCIVGGLIYSLLALSLPYIFLNMSDVAQGLIAIVSLSPLVPFAVVSYFFCGYKQDQKNERK